MSILHIIKNILSRVREAAEKRAEMQSIAELLEWDEHMLDDIGLNREEVLGALAENRSPERASGNGKDSCPGVASLLGR